MDIESRNRSPSCNITGGEVNSRTTKQRGVKYPDRNRIDDGLMKDESWQDPLPNSFSISSNNINPVSWILEVSPTLDAVKSSNWQLMVKTQVS